MNGDTNRTSVVDMKSRFFDSVIVKKSKREIRDILNGKNEEQFSIDYSGTFSIFRTAPREISRSARFTGKRTAAAGNLNPGGQRRKTIVIVSKRLQPNYVNTGPELSGVTML